MKLNPKQKLFCLYYATNEAGTFGNASASYLEAYKEKDKDSPTEESARRLGSQLLTKVDILKRIAEWWKKSGLTDEEVDAHLAMIVRQNTDLANKLGGIREYNKLKQRTADVSFGGRVIIFDKDINKTLDLFHDESNGGKTEATSKNVPGGTENSN